MSAAHRIIRRVTSSVAVVAVVALVAASCINNGTWTAHSPADTTHNTPVFNRQLLSVSCTSPTFCMAVGAGGFSAPDSDLDTPIAQTWDGTAWTDLAWPLVGEDGADPSTVQCLTPTSCFVRYGYWGNADHRDRVAHWDGTTFSPVGEVDLFYPPTTIACARPASCLFTGTTITAWNAGTFSDASGALSDVDLSACVSSVWCMTLDQANRVSSIYGGGNTWSDPVATATPAGSSDWWESVDCSSTTDCISVGTRYPAGTPAAQHWDGTGWTDLVLPISSGNLRAVSCAPTHNCIAVGDSGGHAVSLSWNGNNWNVTAAPPGSAGATYAGVDCVDHWCMAVGNQPAGSTPELLAASYSWTQ